MNIQIISDVAGMVVFLNDPKNTGNIVDAGDQYGLKPDALYLGIYEAGKLIGVHEVRVFWQNVVECHAVYASDCRGAKALEGHKLFCRWLLAHNPFTNSITMVPEHTKYGRAIISLLGATRIGKMDAAYFSNGKPVAVVLYQLTRQQYEELAK